MISKLYPLLYKLHELRDYITKQYSVTLDYGAGEMLILEGRFRTYSAASKAAAKLAASHLTKSSLPVRFGVGLGLTGINQQL